ncbi:MAG: hypothetical protein OXQ29_19505 [Rhodospirillaceae bacterium]|nr:hypothetical protein [Rhodospirillaceae bacterium]
MKAKHINRHRPYGELQQGKPVFWLTRPPPSKWLSLVRATTRHQLEQQQEDKRKAS